MITRATFTDQRETYEAALKSLFAGKPEDTESDLSKLFTPTFTQRDDDTTRDFAAFVAHIRWLREEIPAPSTLDVTTFLRDGSQRAERHLSSTTLPDGIVWRAETFQFVTVAEDGRMDSVVEAVRSFKDESKPKAPK